MYVIKHVEMILGQSDIKRLWTLFCQTNLCHVMQFRLIKISIATNGVV